MTPRIVLILLIVITSLVSCSSIRNRNNEKFITENSSTNDIESLSTTINDFAFSTDTSIISFNFNTIELTIDSLKPTDYVDSAWHLNSSWWTQHEVVTEVFNLVNKPGDYFRSEIYFRINDIHEMHYFHDAGTQTFSIPWGIHSKGKTFEFFDSLQVTDLFNSLSTIEITDSTVFVHMGDCYTTYPDLKKCREERETVGDPCNINSIMIIAISPTGQNEYNWYGIHLTTIDEYSGIPAYYNQFKPVSFAGTLILSKKESAPNNK